MDSTRQSFTMDACELFDNRVSLSHVWSTTTWLTINCMRVQSTYSTVTQQPLGGPVWWQRFGGDGGLGSWSLRCVKCPSRTHLQVGRYQRTFALRSYYKRQTNSKTRCSRILPSSCQRIAISWSWHACPRRRWPRSGTSRLGWRNGRIHVIHVDDLEKPKKSSPRAAKAAFEAEEVEKATKKRKQQKKLLNNTVHFDFKVFENRVWCYSFKAYAIPLASELCPVSLSCVLVSRICNYRFLSPETTNVKVSLMWMIFGPPKAWDCGSVKLHP